MGLSQRYSEDSNDDPVWADVDLTVLAISEHAIAFGEDGEIEYWIPRSLLHKATTQDNGDVNCELLQVDDYVTCIRIPQWLAENRNLAFD